MANAKKCDRCGKFFSIRLFDPDNIRIYSSCGYAVNTLNGDLDLCGDCMKELDEWMDVQDECVVEERSENHDTEI